MKVQDVMMRTPAYCSPDTNLSVAAEIFWNRNCGILPIVDQEQRVTGVVTDRDVCIALGTRNQRPQDVTVAQVASGKVISCRPDDDIRAALDKMAEGKVRRLPVLDAQGRLEGILSMDDIVVRAGAPGLTADVVVSTLKKLYSPNLPEATQRQAASA